MDTNSNAPKDNRRRKLSYAFLAAGFVLLIVAYLVGVSDNPPGIVAMLLGGFLIILGMFYRFGRLGRLALGQELLYWSPRALTIMVALFTSIFAFDVFEEAHGFWETAGALLEHLIPVFVMLIVLAVSWRWEWIGGIVYIGGAIWYVVTMWDRHFPFATYALVAGPIALMGILFLLNWNYRNTLKGGSPKGTIPIWLLPVIILGGFAVAAASYVASIPARESVTFRIEAAAARQVFVAGSFNRWTRQPLSKQPDGQWAVTVSLPHGRHEYKFIVDSVWVHDANNPNKVPLSPPLQGYNSVVFVGNKDTLSFSR